MALSACGTTNWGLPYRADVQQGNWITSEQVAQLRKGMTRDQVRFILGTPTLQDIFRSDRWDYPYFNKPGYGKTQERKFTIFFVGDAVDHWVGDKQPDRQPFQKTDTGMTAAGKVDTSPATATPPPPAPPVNHSAPEVHPVNPAASGANPQPLR
ncbi:MAG: outer membrane protein assembly factor BamE [Paralcaligenes sp.]